MNLRLLLLPLAVLLPTSVSTELHARTHDCSPIEHDVIVTAVNDALTVLSQVLAFEEDSSRSVFVGRLSYEDASELRRRYFGLANGVPIHVPYGQTHSSLFGEGADRGITGQSGLFPSRVSSVDQGEVLR